MTQDLCFTEHQLTIIKRALLDYKHQLLESHLPTSQRTPLSIGRQALIIDIEQLLDAFKEMKGARE